MTESKSGVLPLHYKAIDGATAPGAENYMSPPLFGNPEIYANDHFLRNRQEIRSIWNRDS